VSNYTETNIKQAYEVYTIPSGFGYSKRHVHGYGWTKDEAHAVGRKLGQKYQIGGIHVIQVDNRWHRIAVLPIEIDGDHGEAPISRIARGDLPKKFIPAMFLQVESDKPIRLPRDLEKAIDSIACNVSKGEKQCKLFTIRQGGPLPVEFKGRQLFTDEIIQHQIFNWLKSEIEFRHSQGETE
jgi:hypothetical protein